MRRIDRSFQVLLVDDDVGNAYLLRQVTESGPFRVDLHTVSNGKEGLAFLRRQGCYTGAPIPDLVLLDINMPVMDGHETLAVLVSDPELRSLPVVMLTTSADQGDIGRTYGLRCNTYVVKPRDLAGFEKAIHLIYQYWFTVAALPGRGR